MPASAMRPARPQTERTLESGVPSHKAYAMSGELPGSGDTFGVTPLSAMQGRVPPDESRKQHVRDAMRGTPPPARNGSSGRAQADADHGEPYLD